MTSRDFCYWLQGFFEVSEAVNPKYQLSELQIEVIKKHLSLVFRHEIDPSMGDIKHQEELNSIYNKPTLQELGDIHGFDVKVNEDIISNSHRPPRPTFSHIWSELYQIWYNPEEGVPRC